MHRLRYLAATVLLGALVGCGGDGLRRVDVRGRVTAQGAPIPNATVLFLPADGTSSTVLVVECAARPLAYRNRRADPTVSNDQGICWADSEGPFSFDGAAADGSAEGCGAACAATMNRKNDNEPYSFHPGGGNFLFADGSVRFLRESVGLPTFAALLTKSAGEVVGDY